MGAPSGEAALGDAHERKMKKQDSTIRYFSRTAFAGREVMSPEDALGMASRTLAVRLAVYAVGEASYLPEFVHSFRHSIKLEPASKATQDLRHYHRIRLSFLVTRMVDFGLIARWLYQGGPEVEEPSSPTSHPENSLQN
jgi:hypothetical protein